QLAIATIIMVRLARFERGTNRLEVGSLPLRYRLNMMELTGVEPAHGGHCLTTWLHPYGRSFSVNLPHLLQFFAIVKSFVAFH
ncbi:hypothetical protein, partial [Desulfotomaculum defluvii]